jgi:hypothetical protein
MATKSFADYMTEWDSLQVTVAANAAELGYLEEYRAQLAEAQQGAREASVRQAAFKAQVQKATRDLEDFMSRGKDAATRLRNGIRVRYGLKDEKLTEFRMKPRRKPQRAREQPPEPAPEPSETK